MTARLAWLIDANVISEMMRPRPEPQVAAFLDSIERDGIGLASVTVWEILDGIGRLSPGRRRENLAARFYNHRRRRSRRRNRSCQETWGPRHSED